MDFYKKLEEIKKDKKLNNKTLGESIGKTPDGFRMSLKRKSLTNLEKEKIEQMFFTKKQSKNILASQLINVGDFEISLDQFMDAFIKNRKAIEKHHTFEFFMESLKERFLREYVEELYKETKSKN